MRPFVNFYTNILWQEIMLSRKLYFEKMTITKNISLTVVQLTVCILWTLTRLLSMRMTPLHHGVNWTHIGLWNGFLGAPGLIVWFFSILDTWGCCRLQPSCSRRCWRLTRWQAAWSPSTSQEAWSEGEKETDYLHV